MTDATHLVVLRDADGAYYLLDWNILQQARVDDGAIAALERALEPEVAGYTVPFFTGQLLSTVALQGGQQYGGTFDPHLRYSGVQLQQGQVQHDADWRP